MPVAALQVLRDADRLLESWSCPASTECCRFGITGREPWLTEAEWDLVEREVKRQGRKLPAEPEDRTCPFLSPEGQCTVYQVRPLGCRTFFCEKASGMGSYPRREISRLPRELDALSSADGSARPLTSWLRSSAPGRHSASHRAPSEGTRFPDASARKR